MANKSFTPQKIDPKFVQMLREVDASRWSSGKEKKPIGLREITRMATNAPAMKDLLHQLKTEPRRKDV